MKLYIFLTVSLVASACCYLPKNKNKQNTGEWSNSDWDSADTTAYAGYETEVDTEEYNDYKYTNNWIENQKTSENKYWDLLNTDLNISLDFVNSRLAGQATISLRPHFYNQDSVILDAQNMEISKVSIANNNCPFYINEEKTKLTLKLPKTYSRLETLILTIKYATLKTDANEELDENKAIQSNQGYYFINADLSRPIPRQFWTQGETESNSRWFPTLDAPNQKHTQTITVTVPDTMLVLSNGKRIGETREAGLKTVTWQQTKPHSVYLTMLAVGNWSVISDKYKNKEVEYWVEKPYAPYAKLTFEKTPKMMAFFSDYTGVEFPWDKYTQVVVRDFVSGAMENTSATVHMEALQHTAGAHADNTYESYVSHELFHQWFGDLVTAESWGNISLNESFATYGEYLWIKHFYGEPAADDLLVEFYNSVNRFGNHQGQPLQRIEYHSNDEVFDAVSYQKGALVLHMLNNTIGEDAFRAGIKKYLSDYAFQTAEINDLKTCMESVSGLDLSHFFTQWYQRATMPEYNASVYREDEQWKLSILQMEDNDYFAFSNMDVWYKDNQGKTHKLQIPIVNNNCVVDLNSEPEWIVIDPYRIQLGSIAYSYIQCNNYYDFLYQSFQNCPSPSRKVELFNNFITAKNEWSMENAESVDINPVAYEVNMIKQGLPIKSSYLSNQLLSDYFNYFQFDTTIAQILGANFFTNIANDKTYPNSVRAACIPIANAIDTQSAWIKPLLTDNSNAVTIAAIGTLSNPQQINKLSKIGILSPEIQVAKEWFVKNLYANPDLPKFDDYIKLMSHPFSNELVYGNLEYMLGFVVNVKEATKLIDYWKSTNATQQLQGFKIGLLNRFKLEEVMGDFKPIYLKLNEYLDAY